MLLNSPAANITLVRVIRLMSSKNRWFWAGHGISSEDLVREFSDVSSRRGSAQISSTEASPTV